LLIRATVLAAQAHAQTWVSATGSDSNACTRTAPRQTYQHAHDVTAAFGQVTALDAGDFGPVTINKAITVDGASVATNFATGARITISESTFSSPAYGTDTIGILENFHTPALTNQQVMADNSQFSGYHYAISASNGSNAFFNNGTNGSFTSTVDIF
jgi:hypothetical protein